MSVEDTGVGIPDDERAHIFDEFFRGQEAKKVAAHGTGLGMAVVKRIVEMHGGRIDVTSSPGKGTQFVVTFPPAGAGPAGGPGGRSAPKHRRLMLTGGRRLVECPTYLGH